MTSVFLPQQTPIKHNSRLLPQTTRIYRPYPTVTTMIVNTCKFYCRKLSFRTYGVARGFLINLAVACHSLVTDRPAAIFLAAQCHSLDQYKITDIPGTQPTCYYRWPTKPQRCNLWTMECGTSSAWSQKQSDWQVFERLGLQDSGAQTMGSERWAPQNEEMGPN